MVRIYIILSKYGFSGQVPEANNAVESPSRDFVNLTTKSLILPYLCWLGICFL